MTNAAEQNAFNENLKHMPKYSYNYPKEHKFYSVKIKNLMPI